MPNFGGGELILIVLVVLIVFGAGRLPDVIGQLGKGVRTFREESSGDGPPKTTATTTSDEPKTKAN